MAFIIRYYLLDGGIYIMQTEYNNKKFDQFIDMVAELVLTYHTQQNQIVEKEMPNKSVK